MITLFAIHLVTGFQGIEGFLEARPISILCSKVVGLCVNSTTLNLVNMLMLFVGFRVHG